MPIFQKNCARLQPRPDLQRLRRVDVFFDLPPHVLAQAPVVQITVTVETGEIVFNAESCVQLHAELRLERESMLMTCYPMASRHRPRQTSQTRRVEAKPSFKLPAMISSCTKKGSGVQFCSAKSQNLKMLKVPPSK